VGARRNEGDRLDDRHRHPGGGWKPEGGFLPTDPTHATVKFLTVGNTLWMSAVMPDKSIGGSISFNRFDGLLMSIKDHLSANHPAPPTEIFYVWWNTDPAATDPQPPGQQPVFAGGGPFASQPSYAPRTPAQIAACNAVTVVRGIANTDAAQDTSWTVELRIDLTALGYNITQTQGDIVEFNLSVYDCDNYWPLVPTGLAANRVWWQGPWGNSLGYNEVRIYCKPSVTVNTNPLPYLAPEIIVPNGKLFPSPNIDGLLTDAVWANAARVDIRYGDDALRNTYPGVLKWRGGQYQPTVNGGEAAVLDPGDCTVKYFFRDDSLFFGFDVRDQAVQSVSLTDRMDGFVLGIYDRLARESLDNTLQPHRLTFDVSPTGERAHRRLPDDARRQRRRAGEAGAQARNDGRHHRHQRRCWLHGGDGDRPDEDRLPARARRSHRVLQHRLLRRRLVHPVHR
jgi:hypothetical protein